MKSPFMGSNWLREVGITDLSDLGAEVADVLGAIFAGIYHLNQTSLRKVDWSNPDWIDVIVANGMATVDDDTMTRLVILCHDRCLRCAVTSRARGYFQWSFTRRQRTGSISYRHPTLEQVVADIRAAYGHEVVA